MNAVAASGRERASRMWRSKPRFSRAPSRRPLGRPPLIAGRHKRWVKNCVPTGVAVEQTSNTARGTPGNPAESRYTTLRFRIARSCSTRVL